MAYPWFSFGPFKFQTNERPLDGSDTGWRGAPKINRSTPLGSESDDVQVNALGSDDRSWEARYSVERYNALRALRGAYDELVDLERPVPTRRNCILINVTEVATEARACSDGTTEKVKRARLEFISQ